MNVHTRILGFLFICLLFPISLTAQMKVKKVDVSGLERTKESYLRQFIDIEAGQIWRPDQLEKDLQRVKNLFVVADAQAKVDTIEDEVSVSIQVEEALTLFPIVNFGGVRGNFWFQLG